MAFAVFSSGWPYQPAVVRPTSRAMMPNLKVKTDKPRTRKGRVVITLFRYWSPDPFGSSFDPVVVYDEEVVIMGQTIKPLTDEPLELTDEPLELPVLPVGGYAVQIEVIESGIRPGFRVESGLYVFDLP